MKLDALEIFSIFFVLLLILIVLSPVGYVKIAKECWIWDTSENISRFSLLGSYEYTCTELGSMVDLNLTPDTLIKQNTKHYSCDGKVYHQTNKTFTHEDVIEAWEMSC